MERSIPRPAILLAITAIISFGLSYLLVFLLERNDQQNLSYIQQEISQKIEAYEAFYASLSTDNLTPSYLQDKKAESPIPFYVYKGGRIVFWSDFSLVPDYQEVGGREGLRLVNLSQGTYLEIIHRKTSAKGDWEVVGLLPIYKKLRINNGYINTGYSADIFPTQRIKIYNSEFPNSYPVFYGRTYLFSISFFDSYQLPSLAKVFFAVFYILSFILAFWASWRMFMGLRANKSKYAVWPIVGLVIFRFSALAIDYPLSINSLALFDARNYAVSWWNPSPWDLLSNVALIFLVLQVLGLWLERLRHQGIRIVAYVLSAFASFSGLYALFVTFFIHSPYRLHVFQLYEFSLFHYVILLILCVASLLFVLFQFYLHKQLRVLAQEGGHRGFLMIGLLIASLIAFFIKLPLLLIVLYVGFLCLLYLLNAPVSLRVLNYTSVVLLLLMIGLVSFLGAYTIDEFEQQQERSNKARFAEYIQSKSDVLGEFLLSEIQEKIKRDIFIKNRFITPFAPKQSIEQKVKRIYLNRYFDKYDVTVHVYNSMGQAIGSSPQEAPYPTIKESFALEKFATAYPGLYQVSGEDAMQNTRYLSFIDIERYNVVIGHVLIDLKLKKNIPNSVYPVLLVDKQFTQQQANSDYDYALYNAQGISYHAGSFDYLRNITSSDLKNEVLFTKGILRGAYHHLGVSLPDNQVIIVSKPYRKVYSILANFAFLFCLQLLVWFVILVILTARGFYYKRQINFSTKIQLYLTLAFFVPLLAVSVTNLNLIANSSKERVIEEYNERVRTLTQRLTESVDLYSRNLLSREDLYNELARSTQYTKDDINIYNTNGRLIATSQPLIYENNVLSDYINSDALYAIREAGFSRQVLDETIDQLSYQSAYMGIRAYQSGELIGIIGIPFFSARKELSEQLITVFTNTLITFTLIFILFILIGYLISQTLTTPLKYIAERLSKTSLSERNEELTWRSDDEIGLLVTEYNRMLHNLEASRKALAQQEKEQAWKEMAKQVAHEIKNPLTPMKLSLQHLQRVISDDQKVDIDRVQASIQTLLVQIELLSDIATSFSNFAQMPEPKNATFDIVPVIRQVVDLYQSDTSAEVTCSLPKQAIWVSGDAQLMSRIITNLILNGLQSVDEGQTPKIQLQAELLESTLLLQVQDNGKGIPEAIQDKVFLPNFSTKFSGSGIGLAIAKKGIEHAQGRIWFETEAGKGTVFYIELPLVKE
ncbi:ATP-binding protein [Cytophagales bacterium LB-30]|uniref:histidine kinase n=1 Tax=Shiella aurantiaca TaxID=3058365 RepID=A0ABT8F4K1_9BACT|nr:ATP-binding protein [Shiella aurantiaca]MDN4165174.1 ATP-binding protein [Shiella aurantiaca]